MGPTGAQGPAGKNLVNLPGSVATLLSPATCPAGSTELGTSIILYLAGTQRVTKPVVYCKF
jgi:hypothetical protein